MEMGRFLDCFPYQEWGGERVFLGNRVADS